MFDALDEMLAFTGECLLSGENILQRCLFYSLGSMEVIAVLHVAAIMYLAVVVPMRWLAGNTHQLAHRKWGERSMGRAIDMLHSAFIKIQDAPSLFLDFEYVMHIFESLYDELPEFKDYMDYFKEEREGNVICLCNQSERVLVIDEAMSELFWPTKACNRETTEFCQTLVAGIATTLLMELENSYQKQHLSIFLQLWVSIVRQSLMMMK